MFSKGGIHSSFMPHEMLSHSHPQSSRHQAAPPSYIQANFGDQALDNNQHTIEQGKNARAQGDLLRAMHLFKQAKYHPCDRDVFQEEVFKKLHASMLRIKRDIQQTLDDLSEHDEERNINELNIGFKKLETRYQQLNKKNNVFCEYFSLSPNSEHYLNTKKLQQKLVALSSNIAIHDAYHKLLHNQNNILTEIHNEITRPGCIKLVESFKQAEQYAKLLATYHYQSENYLALAEAYREFSQRYIQINNLLMMCYYPENISKLVFYNLKGKNALFSNAKYLDKKLNDLFLLKKDARELFVKLSDNGLNQFNQFIQQWLNDELVERSRLSTSSFWCSSHTQYRLRKHFTELDIESLYANLLKCEKILPYDLDAMAKGKMIMDMAIPNDDCKYDDFHPLNRLPSYDEDAPPTYTSRPTL